MKTSKFRQWMVIIAPMISILFLTFDLKPGYPVITRTAAVAILMAIWWVTEAVPLAVTALLPIVLFPFLGIMSGKKIAPIYFNHIIFLFIGGFLVALAMEKWNLHKRIALSLMQKIRTQSKFIILGFMATTAFLSMWISNTATTMMMVPIAMAVIYQLEQNFQKSRITPYSKAVYISIAYGASIGGIATIVGTPPNLSFTRILNILFPESPEITFANWFFFAFPISVIFLILVWWLLTHVFFRNAMNLDIDSQIFREQYRKLGKISFEEKVVLLDFLMLIFLWLFRKEINMGFIVIPGWSQLFEFHGYLNDGTVGIAMAIILFMIPSRSHPNERIMEWKTASKLPWNIVLLFGGGFALASGFKESGLTEWLGSQLAGLGGIHPVIIVAVICTLITFLTELTSNTATAEMLLPVLGGMAVAIQINPLFLMIPATLSCSFAFMLPVATPPNAIIFGTGKLKISDMSRVGVWINLLGVIVITAFIFTVGKIIFNIDLSQVPAWVY